MRPQILILGTGMFDNYRAALTAAGARCADAGTPPADCHALLLPGGGDIHRRLPEAEEQIIGAFIRGKRPVLGICRGMQALNVWFGGTLYDRIPGHQHPERDLLHPTHATGLLAELLGRAPTVNSNHHQAVARAGEGLLICQRAADGVIEGIVHRSLPVVGVQWHPERQSFSLRREDAVDATPLFYWLVRQAALHCEGR